MKKTSQIFLLLCSVAVMTSCGPKQQDEIVEGWKPIYASDDNSSIETRASEPLENPGRIYTYDNLLLVNDQAKGIHIYDNSVKTNPTEVSFIAIPGNMDFSIKGNMIYADNVTDMVIIDIANPSAPNVVNRMNNIFPVQQFPDEFGPFECVDETKGTVVGWEKAELVNPKCFR